MSTSNLARAWKNSRDATTRAGRSGIDGVTAPQFAAKLDVNLRALAKRLHDGVYSPDRLKAVFVQKPESDKERLICIPTVRDRIVQRAIAEYLVTTRKLPIYNSSSFGFIKGGGGTRRAIIRAAELRCAYPWCLKTDIESFFDRIPRQYLKTQLILALKSHSLSPLIQKIIDCEVKETQKIRSKLRKQGIKPGVGLRQGMPLSPLLSNLVLSKFDLAVQSADIPMIRYVDDLLLFFPSKEEALRGLEFVRITLKGLDLQVPDLMDGSKTQIKGPSDPVNFLGREIVYLGSVGKIVIRISRHQIAKIRQRLEREFTCQARLKEESNFQDTVVDLSTSISSYLGIYKDTHNYISFNSELRAAARKIISDILIDIFGEGALFRVDDDGRDFLGIGELQFPEPAFDLEF